MKEQGGGMTGGRTTPLLEIWAAGLALPELFLEILIPMGPGGTTITLQGWGRFTYLQCLCEEVEAGKVGIKWDFREINVEK